MDGDTIKNDRSDSTEGINGTGSIKLDTKIDFCDSSSMVLYLLMGINLTSSL